MFEIVMGIDDFLIQLVKYCIWGNDASRIVQSYTDHGEEHSERVAGFAEKLLRVNLRNDETIISSISVTDIFFDVYLGKWNYRAITKVKTWSYFLTIPKLASVNTNHIRR